MQGIAANKKPDAECPQTDCERVDGEWQRMKCCALQQVSKRPTTFIYVAEGLSSSQP